MKKLLFGTILLALVFVFPTPAMTAVDLGIRISLPPPIVFATPPEMVVIPETYVYVDPDLDVDIFFYRGWWWRLWEGRCIARGTTMQVGATIETFHLFIDGYHQVGGTTIGRIVGEGINGTINEYPTNKSNRIGAAGKRANIGRSKILGVSKA